MAAPDESQVEGELLPLLASKTRPDVRGVAMEYFLGLTGTEEGRSFLASKDKYLAAIVDRVEDDLEAISKDALLALVNLCQDGATAWKLLHLQERPEFGKSLLTYVLRKDAPHADIGCSLLSNMSRSEQCAEDITATMVKHHDTVGFERLIFAFCHENYNSKNKLHYLGPFLSNLTQTRLARRHIMDKKRCVVQRLLPFISYKESLARRGGIVGALKNCCFETEYHSWLLSDEVDMLPRLLLPLAGPEEFDDDDLEKLPDDLQYLEPDKERESDPDIRKMLVESLNQLCTTKACRTYIRDKNTYVILRELFTWEKDPANKVAIENVVQILIGDEPQPGMENLNEVEVPEDVQEKLRKASEQMEKEIEEETRALQLEEEKTKEEEKKKSENSQDKDSTTATDSSKADSADSNEKMEPQS